MGVGKLYSRLTIEFELNLHFDDIIKINITLDSHDIVDTWESFYGSNSNLGGKS